VAGLLYELREIEVTPSIAVIMPSHGNDMSWQDKYFNNSGRHRKSAAELAGLVQAPQRETPSDAMLELRAERDREEARLQAFARDFAEHQQRLATEADRERKARLRARGVVEEEQS
jgi:hypothetical protein